MKTFLAAVAAIVVLVIVAVVAIPFLVPKDAVVAELSDRVEAATGRTLTVAGDVDVSVLPNLAVTVGGVRFQGFEGGQDLVALDQLELRLALLPLLGGNVQVDRFVLVRPEINLATTRQGRANWDILPRSGGEQGRSSLLKDIQLRDVVIVDGRLTYRDEATGMTRTVEGLDASLDLASLSDPLSLQAGMTMDGRPVQVEATVSPARTLLDGGQAEFNTALSMAGTDVALDGTLSMPAAGQGAGPTVAGALRIGIDSLPGLIAWATGAAPEALPVETVALTGQVTAGADRITLSDMSLTAGDIAAGGSVAIALGGPRPAIKGTIAVSQLDLDALLPPPAAEKPAAPAAADQGWSREPIDLSALKAADADLDVTLAGVTMSGVDVGRTTLSVDLENGRLDATLGETEVFGGRIQGRAVANARGQVPSFQLEADMTGVQAEPVLTRFADFRRLTGTTDAEIDISTKGPSLHDIMAAMDGQARLLFKDGAVKGINIAQLVRSATGGGTAGDEPPQTDFAELGGSFTIADGTARTQDLRMLAPLLRLTGSGQVMLGERRVDMRIVPRLVASIEGQGTAAVDKSGLSVPILVRGSFSDLSFTPDLAGIATEALKDPAKIQETIQGIKDAPASLKDGLGGALGGVLGGQAPAADGQQPVPTAPKPEDAVRGLLQGVLGGKQPAAEETQPPPSGGQ